MDRKTSLFLSSIFIVAGGLIFTIERMSAYIYWSALKSGNTNWDQSPEMPSIFDNIFVPLFFLIGIIILIKSNRKKIKANAKRT